MKTKNLPLSIAFIAIICFFILAFIVDNGVYAKLFSSLSLVIYFIAAQYSSSIK